MLAPARRALSFATLLSLFATLLPLEAHALPPAARHPRADSTRTTKRLAAADPAANSDTPLTGDKVRQVMREQIGPHIMPAVEQVAFSQCGKLSGRLAVHFIIQKNGRVRDLAAESDTTQCPVIFERLKPMIRRLRFPKPTDEVVVSYPFTFSTVTAPATP